MLDAGKAQDRIVNNRDFPTFTSTKQKRVKRKAIKKNRHHAAWQARRQDGGSPI